MEGSFMKTAGQCWADLHQKLKPLILAKFPDATLQFVSFYALKPEQVYRAAIVVSPKQGTIEEESARSIGKGIPEFGYFYFAGANYASFTLLGSYSQLPTVVGQVMEIAHKTLKVNEDQWYIEYYDSNPDETPEEELVTEILIPLK
ncbi:hypothetical protein HDV03_000429 [Kappamyces sp. JEL0829]|nr:hypothetical protein HDV03_000429 [Kappamyces sp. JEL0829]